MEYIKQISSEKETIILWNLPGKEREFSFPRLFQYMVLNFYYRTLFYPALSTSEAAL